MLTVVDVAARLGLSAKAVRGLISRGELPAYKVAGRIRVDADDLAAYLDHSRVMPSPTAVAFAPGPAMPVRGSLVALDAAVRSGDE